MAAMQQQAYLEDDDTMMDMNDEHDPAMQEFFRQIEEMRDTAQQVAKEVDKVKKNSKRYPLRTHCGSQNEIGTGGYHGFN